MHAIFANHIREVFFLPLDKFINRQGGICSIIACKVISGTYLHDDILTDRHDLHRYQLRDDENH